MILTSDSPRVNPPRPAPSLDARLAALEADVAALTADRQWLVARLAEIVVEVKQQQERHP